MSVSREKMISLVMLLTGYSALIAGLLALAVHPLLGVLMVLGGMALSVCSAIELVQAPAAAHPVSPGK
jgi:hypothetical protein